MREKLQCPFCGSHELYVESDEPCYIECENCGASTGLYSTVDQAIDAWNMRAPQILKVETSFYDREETFENCTVQVLTNTKTGDVSVGWWKNGGEDDVAEE